MKPSLRNMSLAAGGVALVGLAAYGLSMLAGQQKQLAALSTQLAPSATNLDTSTPEAVTGCVMVEQLSLRSGPGGEYPVVGELNAGDCLRLDGRSPDEVWVRSPEGWLAAASLNVDGPLDTLPVPSIPPTPYTIYQPTTTEVQTGCPSGCTQHVPGCDIKGNISYNTGEKIYHVPGGEFYEDTVINPAKGERWFCTEAEAIANGWRASQR